MQEAEDRARCPACGARNHCAMSAPVAGKAFDCWCLHVVANADAPQQPRADTCLCARCLLSTGKLAEL